MKPKTTYNYTCSRCGKQFTKSKAYQEGEDILCHGCSISKYYQEHPEAGVKRTQKAKDTVVNRYGVDNVSKSPEFQKKISEGLIKSYSDPERKKGTLDKRINTNLQRRGYEWPVLDPNVLAKQLETQRANNNGKIGWEDPKKQIASEIAAHSEEANKKRIKTHLNNCKEENAVRKLYNSNKLKGYIYNNIRFDSSWELALYIYLTDNKKQFLYHPDMYFEYQDENNITHVCWPDFLIEGQFYEIKGEQFFNDKGEPYNRYTKVYWWSKYNALTRNNVKIIRVEDIKPYLRYISDTYGKHYLKSFKVE